MIHTNFLQDKVEFFEATSLDALEKQISKKVEINLAIMLEVHHVSHQVTIDPSSSKRLYTASVHFKAKRMS